MEWGKQHLFTRYPFFLEDSANCNNRNIDIELLCNEINHFLTIHMWLFFNICPQCLSSVSSTEAQQPLGIYIPLSFLASSWVVAPS